MLNLLLFTQNFLLLRHDFAVLFGVIRNDTVEFFNLLNDD